MGGTCDKCCPCLGGDREERSAGRIQSHVQEGDIDARGSRTSSRHEGVTDNEELNAVLLSCEGGRHSSTSTPIASPISVPATAQRRAFDSHTRTSHASPRDSRRQTVHSVSGFDNDEDFASCLSASEIGDVHHRSHLASHGRVATPLRHTLPHAPHAGSPVVVTTAATQQSPAEPGPRAQAATPAGAFGPPDLGPSVRDAFAPINSPVGAGPKTVPGDLGRFADYHKCPSRLLATWRFYGADNLVHLGKGGCLYNFVCAPGSELCKDVLAMLRSFVHLSCFDDPSHAKPVDVHSATDLAAHIFIVNKAQYVLPHPIDVTKMTPDLLGKAEYHKACQPKNPKIWTDVQEAHTFRMTKTVIPLIMKITIQLRCSMIPEDEWPALSAKVCEGLPIFHALLLERTKRDMTLSDATRTLKSILLFHKAADGGALVTSVTCVANTSIPTVVAKIVDSFGSSGAEEVAETATRTRKYFIKHLT